MAVWVLDGSFLLRLLLMKLKIHIQRQVFTIINVRLHFYSDFVLLEAHLSEVNTKLTQLFKMWYTLYIAFVCVCSCWLGLWFGVGDARPWLNKLFLLLHRWPLFHYLLCFHAKSDFVNSYYMALRYLVYLACARRAQLTTDLRFIGKWFFMTFVFIIFLTVFLNFVYSLHVWNSFDFLLAHFVAYTVIFDMIYNKFNLRFIGFRFWLLLFFNNRRCVNWLLYYNLIQIIWQEWLSPSVMASSSLPRLDCGFLKKVCWKVFAIIWLAFFLKLIHIL